MKLLVKREKSNDKCTIGVLSIDGVFECYTLEDIVRNIKIQNETAIPAGTYDVSITFSPHFKRELPLIMNVPNFQGVRIHPGNTASDTEGCMLVGKSRGDNRVNNSADAFRDLYEKTYSAWIKKEPITITIENAI